MINSDDIKPGQIYSWVDVASGGHETVQIVIVGFDTRTAQWVASCENWALDLSYIDEEDFDVMELIQDVTTQEVKHWTTY